MKQKPDETLDKWVRQTLSQLPDAPPPGSAFNSGRLWEQLRPELQATSNRRQIGLTWWMAAACLTGLTLGWFWLPDSTTDHKAVVAQRFDRKEKASIVSRRSSKPADEVVKPKTVFIDKNQPILGLKIRSHQKKSPEQESAPLRIEAVEAEPQSTELAIVAAVLPVVEKPIERSKPNVATTAPKQRFRVVHENELQAEEEARPKLYRTEHFVRIGTGERSELTPNENPPSLTLPLTHKPTQ